MPAGKLSQRERRMRKKAQRDARPAARDLVVPAPCGPPATRRGGISLETLKLSPGEGVTGQIWTDKVSCPCGCGSWGHSVTVEGFIPGELIQLTIGADRKQMTLVTQSGKLRVDDFGLEKDGCRFQAWNISRGRKKASIWVSPRPPAVEAPGIGMGVIECFQKIMRIGFDCGLDVMIPANWELMMAEPGKLPCCRGSVPQVSSGGGGSASVVVSATDVAERDRIASEIEEANRIAGESRALRRSAAAAASQCAGAHPKATTNGAAGQDIDARDHGRISSSGSTKGVQEVDRGEESCSRDKVSRTGLARKSKGVPQTACLDIEYDRLWRKYPQLFEGGECPCEGPGQMPVMLPRQVRRPGRRKKRSDRGSVDLDELIMIDKVLTAGTTYQEEAEEEASPGRH